MLDIVQVKEFVKIASHEDINVINVNTGATFVTVVMPLFNSEWLQSRRIYVNGIRRYNRRNSEIVFVLLKK